MNLHAEKIDYNAAIASPESVDPMLGGVVEELDALKTSVRPNAYMRRWYSLPAAKQLLAFRDLAQSDVLRVVLSRAARSVSGKSPGR